MKGTEIRLLGGYLDDTDEVEVAEVLDLMCWAKVGLVALGIEKLVEKWRVQLR